MSFSELAQSLLDRQGFIVVINRKQLEIGQVTPFVLHGNHPEADNFEVVVLAHATKQDFDRQSQLALTIGAVTLKCDSECYPEPPYFYKVMAE